MFSANAPIAAKQINVNILGGVELLRNFEEFKLFINDRYIGGPRLSRSFSLIYFGATRAIFFKLQN